MSKLYFTNAMRHLRRSPLFTTLNIAGLAISISACWVIYRLVQYEFSYDTHIPDRAHVYRVFTGFKFDEETSFNGGVCKPMYQALRQEATGLKRVVPVQGIFIKSVHTNPTDGKPANFEEQSDIACTDAAYFSLVPYHWLAGTPGNALQAPDQVVLTESRAKQYFPGRTPGEVLNRTLTYYSYRDTVKRTISGVVSDLQGPTEFTSKEFCSLPVKDYALASWTNTNGTDRLYLQLDDKAVPAAVLSTIDRLAAGKQRQFEQSNKDNFKFDRWFVLIPVSESHFSTFVKEYNVHKADKKIMVGLMGIGFFLLLLACINYINMGVASIPQRSKEIGVRKTLGSSQPALIGQFLAETLLVSLMACALAYILAWVEFGLLKEILPPNLERWGGIWQATAFLALLAMMVTFLSGLYPGWLIAKVKTVQVFRRVFVLKHRGGRIGFQKALIVFQFVIALVFISGAMIVGSQLHFLVNSDMGFEKDAVVLVDVPWKFASNAQYKDKQFSLLAELRTIPGIHDVALGDAPLSDNYSSSQFSYYRDGKPPVSRQVYRKTIDTGYLGLYGFHLLAGRNLHPSDTTDEVIINETAVKAFGFASPRDAVGKMIGQTAQGLLPIVGVVKDFHTQNFYKAIDPMAFMSEKDNLTSINIKLDAAHPATWPETLQAIGKKWYAFYPPGSYAYTFYDETIAELYKNERNLSTLINLTTGISIFISCLGLLGLAVLTALQRTKEIGIRKVLGASVAGIVGLLSKEYLRLVVCAILIATPITWWLAHQWLRNFVYKIPLSWWLFVLAGFSGLLIAFLTVGFQALKAAHSNPVKSLRSE